MRIKTEVTELDHRQWAYLKKAPTTGYQFTEGQSRVCAVFTNEDSTEELHTEMPVAVYQGILMGLSITGVVDAVRTAMDTLAPRVSSGDEARPL
jgi:hypothetical protein